MFFSLSLVTSVAAEIFFLFFVCFVVKNTPSCAWKKNRPARST
jgi:hypothetical protein